MPLPKADEQRLQYQKAKPQEGKSSRYLKGSSHHNEKNNALDCP